MTLLYTCGLVLFLFGLILLLFSPALPVITPILFVGLAMTVPQLNEYRKEWLELSAIGAQQSALRNQTLENRHLIACEAHKLQLEQAGKNVPWKCN